MQIIYGTTNQGKLDSMRNRLKSLNIEILSLNDVASPKLTIPEVGNSPLANARIKATAYFEALQRPVFSADSGLYIDGLALDDPRQPGVNVRGANDYMDDETAIAYYAALSKSLGGRIVARYSNAICLVMGNGVVFEHDHDDISSKPFIIADVPHPRRTAGFPLDSLSINITSGKYFMDEEIDTTIGDAQKYGAHYSGFVTFFQKILDFCDFDLKNSGR